MAPPRKAVKITSAEASRRYYNKMRLLSPESKKTWRKPRNETQRRYAQRQKENGNAGNKSRSVHNLTGPSNSSGNINQATDQDFYQNLSVRQQNQSQPNLGDNSLTQSQLSHFSSSNTPTTNILDKISKYSNIQITKYPASAYFNIKKIQAPVGQAPHSSKRSPSQQNALNYNTSTELNNIKMVGNERGMEAFEESLDAHTTPTVKGADLKTKISFKNVLQMCPIRIVTSSPATSNFVQSSPAISNQTQSFIINTNRSQSLPLVSQWSPNASTMILPKQKLPTAQQLNKPCILFPGKGVQMRYRARKIMLRTYGPQPRGIECSHLCDDRRCIEPTHLVPETHQMNLRRKICARLQLLGGPTCSGNCFPRCIKKSVNDQNLLSLIVQEWFDTDLGREALALGGLPNLKWFAAASA